MAESTGNPPSANDREGAQGGADASHPATSAVKDAASDDSMWEGVRRMMQAAPTEIIENLKSKQKEELKEKLGMEDASTLLKEENKRVAALLYHHDEAFSMWKGHVKQRVDVVVWEKREEDYLLLCSRWSKLLQEVEAQKNLAQA